MARSFLKVKYSMGLYRALRRRERCYSLLAGFFLVYISWSFISSQERIDALRNGRETPERQRIDLPAGNSHLQHRINIPHGSSRNDDKLYESFQKRSIAPNLHDDVIAPNLHDDVVHIYSEEHPIPLPPSNEEINPRNKVDPDSSDRKSSITTNKKEDARDEMKLSVIDLPNQGKSAFNQRMKTELYAPEAGNVLPNYFLYAESMNKTRHQYGDTVVTYLHHNKAAGSSVKDCLGKVSRAQRARISLMDSNGRSAAATRLKQRGNAFKFYMGGYSFGVCEQLSPQTCSYFTFVRDPYERVISSYSYCRRAAGDQLCQPGDPWAMTMKEWVLFQGSFLFRQILFRPEFCRLPRPKLTDKMRNARGIPCWYKEKLHLKDSLNDTMMEDLLDYVLLNLDKWFAVIGVTDEYDTSLAMLEEAYGIPFHSKCSGKRINVSDYKNVEVKGSAANETEHDVFVKTTKAELMADEEVRLALRADIKIYEQAKLIFERQREKYKLLHGLV
ncbi:uncharacterized protein [Apostichopus japonicus]|uniref:uncharacterized protein isoform X2 n=1 Tax=Stichopus japonicus TaxID=307972 RepID=UPI003AB315CD